MTKPFNGKPAKLCIAVLVVLLASLTATYFYGAGICRIRLLSNEQPLSGARVEVIGGASSQPRVLQANTKGWINFGWKAFEKRGVVILKVIEPASVQIEGLLAITPGHPQEFDHRGSNTVIVTERLFPLMKRTVTQVET